VSDLGTKSLLSSEEQRCGQPDKVDLRTNALINLDTCSTLSDHLFFVLTPRIATAGISRALPDVKATKAFVLLYRVA